MVSNLGRIIEEKTWRRDIASGGGRFDGPLENGVGAVARVQDDALPMDLAGGAKTHIQTQRSVLWLKIESNDPREEFIDFMLSVELACLCPQVRAALWPAVMSEVVLSGKSGDVRECHETLIGESAMWLGRLCGGRISAQQRRCRQKDQSKNGEEFYDKAKRSGLINSSRTNFV